MRPLRILPGGVSRLFSLEPSSLNSKTTNNIPNITTAMATKEFIAAMEAKGVLSFPLGTTFKYLNEGAANIVYRIELPPVTPQPSVLEEYEEGEPAPGDLEVVEVVPNPFASKLISHRR